MDHTAHHARFTVGHQAMFRWYESDTEGMLCEVVGISFREGKVLYDIAPFINGEAHYAQPLCSVDSIFIHDLPASMVGLTPVSKVG